MIYNSDVPEAVILTLPRRDTVISDPDFEVNYQTIYLNCHLSKIRKSFEEEYMLINNALHKISLKTEDFKYIKFFSLYSSFSYLFCEKFFKFVDTDVTQISLNTRFYCSEVLNYEMMSLIFNMKRIVDHIIQYDCYLKNTNLKIYSIGGLLKSQNQIENESTITINAQNQHMEHILFLKLLNKLDNSHKHDLFITYNLPNFTHNTDRVFAVEQVKRQEFQILIDSFFNFDPHTFEEVEEKTNKILCERDFFILEYNISIKQLMISFYYYFEELFLNKIKKELFCS